MSTMYTLRYSAFVVHIFSANLDLRAKADYSHPRGVDGVRRKYVTTQALERVEDINAYCSIDDGSKTGRNSVSP
jgi:hypothetical protein